MPVSIAATQLKCKYKPNHVTGSRDIAANSLKIPGIPITRIPLLSVTYVHGVVIFVLVPSLSSLAVDRMSGFLRAGLADDRLQPKWVTVAAAAAAASSAAKVKGRMSSDLDDLSIDADDADERYRDEHEPTLVRTTTEINMNHRN